MAKIHFEIDTNNGCGDIQDIVKTLLGLLNDGWVQAAENMIEEYYRFNSKNCTSCNEHISNELEIINGC